MAHDENSLSNKAVVRDQCSAVTNMQEQQLPADQKLTTYQ
jgi:hypothetical protein